MVRERRRTERHSEESLLLALLRLDGGQEVDAFVRNLSLSGMMIEPLFGEGMLHLAPGVRLRCARPPLHLDVLRDVTGAVCWSGEGTAGLSFDAPLPLDDEGLQVCLAASGVASWADLLADDGPPWAERTPPARAAPKRRRQGARRRAPRS